MILRPKKVNRRVRKKEQRPSLWQRANEVLAPWRRGLLLTVFFVTGGSAVWQAVLWIQGMDHLTLQQVRVEGRFDQLSREVIGDLVQPYSGVHFFDVDVVGIQRQMEQQPWIKSASVRREWPDALVISVHEQVPVARWGDQGLINQQGEAFYPAGGVSAALQSLPVLHGVEGSQQTLLRRLQRVVAAFKPVGLDVVAVHMDARGSWKIMLGNDLQLMMGRDYDEQRIARFLAFYPAIQTPQAGSLAVMDMRYPNGFALRWQVAPGTKATTG